MSELIDEDIGKEHFGRGSWHRNYLRDRMNVLFANKSFRARGIYYLKCQSEQTVLSSICMHPSRQLIYRFLHLFVDLIQNKYKNINTTRFTFFFFILNGTSSAASIYLILILIQNIVF